ncbi:hypothetical protein PFLmoz3_05399 [Pseudomonas fluorescens]|uniref:Uncharacterized protein n=1 Tax=Pseudomonas fluorescens TaxID=294 RepID=A0A109LCJ8_PSEFL|nr:hypothetical protein PFLmoz3_05399 [Pseudomonas fluorescens]
MSLERMSRANTLLPQTFDKASLRWRALPLWPSHFSDGTVTLFSIKAASAWVLSGVSVTLTPATSPPWRNERRVISRLDMDHPLSGYKSALMVKYTESGDLQKPFSTNQKAMMTVQS